MVDCRPAGAPPHEIAHSSNGVPPENHQNQQAAGSGDMVVHGGAVPASVRASTPATTNAITTYSANYNGVMNPAPPPGMGVGGVGYGCAPYACGAVKGLVWCGPHAPPPPPPGVNPHVYKSVQPSGADLPMNDIATLRFYFNLGVDCMWAAYGAPQHAPLPHPPPPHMPPRHYSPRDLAQDMQQISLHERGAGALHDPHKHKQDKLPLAPPKGQGQRPLLGPRFKRGNQDGNQNNNHNHQNKGHNNNTPNKGMNNRRNSHTDMRTPHAYAPVAAMGAGAVPADECALEAPLVSYPYIPYPPPIYPLPYYPMDSDPGMMGMMGGMGYVSYEEGVEYAPVQHFYPPPYPPPLMPEHK